MLPKQETEDPHTQKEHCRRGPPDPHATRRANGPAQRDRLNADTEPSATAQRDARHHADGRTTASVPIRADRARPAPSRARRSRPRAVHGPAAEDAGRSRIRRATQGRPGDQRLAAEGGRPAARRPTGPAPRTRSSRRRPGNRARRSQGRAAGRRRAARRRRAPVFRAARRACGRSRDGAARNAPRRERASGPRHGRARGPARGRARRRARAGWCRRRSPDRAGTASRRSESDARDESST